ncbi:hypothetical protein Tco_0551580 [Tanacetum coccineum]
MTHQSSSSAVGFKTPLDMFGVFGWLASIKQGMLKPVKVKCIFLGYYNDMDSYKLWRLDDVTSKVLQGVEFEVELQDDHTFEVISKWKAGLKEDMDVQSYVYVLSNGCRKSLLVTDSHDIWEYAPSNVIHIVILYIWYGFFLVECKLRSGIKGFAGFGLSKGKCTCIWLEGHSDYDRCEDSLLGDFDVEHEWHINVHYHSIREVLEATTVKVLKVCTEHNVAAALTKVVPGWKFQHCLELLSLSVG